ncbi:conjugal transfer protein TraD [Niabella sp. W65]|nr:conjugal transfer protein TraD [Niabella sp. W65]MCH7363134.1 conjugal transfer protein TraD [Niabella sp. W65]
MEIIIVICLLIVIALLLQDKIVIHKRSEQKPTQEKVNPNLPDIMGQPKPVRSLLVPNTANESQITEPEINLDNLDIEYDENVSIQIPQEELDEVFSNMPDLEEEEEEWNRYGISGGDNGFAQGVTYDELSSVGALLQKENLEQAQKETAVAIVQKLQEPNYSAYWKIPLRVLPEKLPSFWIAHFHLKATTVLPLCGKVIWVILTLGSLSEKTAPFCLFKGVAA